MGLFSSSSKSAARKAARKAKRAAKREAKKGTTPAPSTTSSSSKVYSGPVAPGTSESTFRSTGASVPSPTKTTISSGGGSSGGSSVYQGPVQPGTSEEIFRETGASTPLVQGPVQPGTSESTFRETGKTITTTSSTELSVRDKALIAANIEKTSSQKERAGESLMISATSDRDMSSSDTALRRARDAWKYGGIGGLGEGFQQLFTSRKQKGQEEVFLGGEKFGDVDVSMWTEGQKRRFSNLMGGDVIKTKFEVEEKRLGKEIGIKEEFQSTAQEKFNIFAEPLVEARTRGFQTAVDLGQMEVGEAQKQLDIELGGISTGFMDSPEYKKLTGEAKEKIGDVGKRYSNLGEFKPSGFGDVAKTGEIISTFHPVGMSVELAKSAQADTIKAQTKALGITLGGGETTYVGGGKLSLRTGLAMGGMALIGGGTALGQFRAIEKGLVSEELSMLSKSPVKFETYIDKTTGLTKTRAIQKAGKLTRETEMTGFLKKTESGKLFIPEGVGESKIYGDLAWNIRGGVKPSKYVGTQAFEFGAMSGGKPISFESLTSKEIIAIPEGTKIFGTVGETTLVPQMQSSAIWQMPSTLKGAAKEGKIIGKQLGKIEYGGDVIKAFEGGTLFKTKGTLGFDIATTRSSRGKIFEIETPKQIETFGFKGKGKTSSPEYFKELYKQPKIEVTKIAPKVEAPIRSNGLVLQPKVSPKVQPQYSPSTKILTRYKILSPSLGTKSLNYLKLGIGAKSLMDVSSKISSKMFQPTKLKSFLQPRTESLLKPRTDTILKERTSEIFKTPTPTISTGLGGFIPAIPSVPIPPIIPFKPNLAFGKPKGVGKFKAKRDYQYIQSFGGYFTGKVGRTKGIMINGREVFTGMEVRGAVKPKTKKKISKKKKK